MEVSLNRSSWSFGRSGSVWMRTRESDGLLMYAHANLRPVSGDFLMIDVISGQPRFTADLGSGE